MKALTFIISVLLTTASTAQVFPVQVSVQLTPPYTPYLSDYTAPGAQRFQAQVYLNDLNVVNYYCRLRITIEGVGIAIRTKENHTFRPLILEGAGLPQIFYGEDIHEYFHPDALEFSGLSRSEYGERARLPEGIYRFIVEVLDYNRGTVVSNRGSATAWIMLNDPPMLNLPFNFSKVPLQDPPNILFTWTPRHTGSPNAAFSTGYTFRLIELWPENRNPYDAFLTQPTLFETTTTANQLLYGATEPQLLPGRKYAWQVEARDEGGRDLFKNRGRSEAFVFQYGEALAVPANLRMRWAKPTTLAIQWDAVKTKEDIRYRLQYRPDRRKENREWYETWTRFTDKTLYHLQANTGYEMRIRSENSLQESEYSEIRTFKTLRQDDVEFVCRDDVDPPPLPGNTSPVFPLSINDTIHAGGYQVLVRDVMKDGSRYYGSGLAIVPWLNGAKVRVTFEKISVNDQFWLTAGTIRSVWDGGSRSLIEEETPVTPGQAPQAGGIDITVVAADSLMVVEGAAIAAVTKDGDGNIVVTTTDGKQAVIPKGRSVAIADETGSGYVVDKQGNVAKTTASEATAAADRGERQYALALTFSNGRGRFGFDEKKYDGLAHYYQQLGDGTYVAWKALSSATQDELTATVESARLNPDDIAFEAGGARLTPVKEGAALTLHLRGKAGGMEEELLALYRSADTLPPRVFGKVNLATYNHIRHNVEIIPVNGAQLPGGLDAGAISRHLNSVYGQAVVTWNVTLRPNLEVPLDDTFDDGDAGVFSNYTADMKKVLKAFEAFQDDTWYLFVIETPRDLSTLGYMPRNRQAGFVFSRPHEGNAQDFLRTVAHELGHGAFNLKHTFSEHSLPAGITDNLMDYGEGTALYKYQWDHIHEPQTGLGLFGEVGESGAMKSELVSFYEDAAPLLREQEYRQWVEKLKKVYEFLETCQEEGWESYNGRGIFPYCFWRDQNVPSLLHYTIADLAFTAGFVDGGYVELEGFYHLPDVVRDISRLPGKILYAYTLAYWQCRDSRLIARAEDYEYVIEQLAKVEEEGGIWNWVREQWHDYKGNKESLEKYFADCKDADDLRETIEDLFELATHWEQIKELSKEVFNNLKVYWDTLSASTNHGRYERGALIIPTATLLMPLGVGVASKAEKLKAVIKLLQEASHDNLQRIAKRIGEVLWVRGGKIPSGSFMRKTYDDCIRAGYTPYYDGNDILFRTIDDVLVAKISNDELYIKIPEHHGVWAQQSTTANAMSALEKANSGMPLYRVGTYNISAAAEAQYWSLENPLAFKDIKNFSNRYGIPEENIRSGRIFVEIGVIKENIPRVTREAPGFGNNSGGSIELVVPKNGVRLQSFHTISF